ncbi:MAG: hypothetical protein GXP02_05400 [Alphaproteobacteria bacterium]|nr:hypothetical protein [Alphaproteobacteria bacterium]
MAKTLTKDTAEQFKVLLTEDKSRRYLLDKCLGSAKVISDQDPEKLLSFMRQSLVSDIQKESDKKMAVIGSEKKAVLDELSSTKERLKLAELEDKKLILHHLSIVNKKAKMIQWVIKGAIIFIIALISFKLPISGIPPILLSFFSGAIIFVLLYMQILDKPVKLDRLFKWLATGQLKKYAEKIGIEEKLKRFSLPYDVKRGFTLDIK